MLKAVAEFYNKWENLGLKITFVLVSLQIIHLFWLTTFVVLDMPELTGGIPPLVFVILDYLEIPALISGIAFYLLLLTRPKRETKNLLYLGLLLVQCVHLFWITDTFVYMAFQFNQFMYLAWIAILIDYLELPVVYDLYKRIRNKE
jgi:hypothetical protein